MHTNTSLHHLLSIVSSTPQTKFLQIAQQLINTLKATMNYKYITHALALLYSSMYHKETVHVHTQWYTYHSVSGKRPWALKHKHNSRFQPAWALSRDINCIRLYGSCYILVLEIHCTWVFLLWQLFDEFAHGALFERPHCHRQLLKNLQHICRVHTCTR